MEAHDDFDDGSGRQVFDHEEADVSDARDDAYDVQEARGEARDEIDAALTERDAEPSEKSLYQQRSGGISLIWWNEEAGESPLVIAADMLDEANSYIAHTDDLVANGLREHALAAVVEIDIRSGPIVIAALQLLGLLEPRLRETVAGILTTVGAAIPPATEEENEELRAAHEVIAAKQQEAMLQAFTEMGAQVMTPEQYEEHLAAENERQQDAGLN